MSVALFFLAACAPEAAAPPAAKAPSAQAVPAAAASAEEVVATWNGGKISRAQLEEKIQGELAALKTKYLMDRYELESGGLQSMVDEKLLEAAATSGGFDSVEAMLIEHIEKQTPEPSEEDILGFFESVKRQLGGATYEQARPQLKLQLHQNAMGERFDTYMKAMRSKQGVAMSIAYPDLPRAEVEINADDPVLGPEGAPITIVQYAEYQCYYCSRVAPTIDQLMEDYPGQIRLVFKDFPLNFHADAVPAAVAAHCAGAQGKYWEMNKILLANQDKLSGPDLLNYGAELSLDRPAFQECMDSGVYEAGVYADLNDGQKLGVEATPTFFVNGLLLSGAQPYDRFAAIVDQELANATN